jgi:hypothetical protein
LFNNYDSEQELLKTNRKLYYTIFNLVCEFLNSEGYTRSSLLNLDSPIIVSLEDVNMESIGLDGLGVLKIDVQLTFDNVTSLDNPLNIVSGFILEISTKGLSEALISELDSFYSPVLLKVVEYDKDYMDNCRLTLSNEVKYDFQIDLTKLKWEDFAYYAQFRSNISLFVDSGIHDLSNIVLTLNIVEPYLWGKKEYSGLADIFGKLDSGHVSKCLSIDLRTYSKLYMSYLEELLKFIYQYLQNNPFNYITNVHLLLDDYENVVLYKYVSHIDKNLIESLQKLSNCTVTLY